MIDAGADGFRYFAFCEWLNGARSRRPFFVKINPVNDVVERRLTSCALYA
jgi:hypothetical protein